MRRLLTLWCADLSPETYCCSSCHEDAQEGYDDLMDVYPPNKDGSENMDYGGHARIRAFVCCAVYRDIGDEPLTRSDWARKARERRRKNVRR